MTRGLNRQTLHRQIKQQRLIRRRLKSKLPIEICGFGVNGVYKQVDAASLLVDALGPYQRVHQQ